MKGFIVAAPLMVLCFVMLACSESRHVQIVPQSVSTTVTVTTVSTPPTLAFRECSHDGVVYKQSPLEPCRAGDKAVRP